MQLRLTGVCLKLLMDNTCTQVYVPAFFNAPLIKEYKPHAIAAPFKLLESLLCI